MRKVENKQRKFKYAPPRFTQTKSKYVLPSGGMYLEADDDKYKASIYFWWYEYLRRSEDYKRCCECGGKGKLAKLYRDFGNVFAEAETDKEAFRFWWREHAHLFWESEGRKVDEPNKVNDLESTDLVVRLPLNETTNYIVSNVRLLLKKNSERVKRARQHSRALYPVASKVRITTLQTQLHVYDTHLANPKLKLHELSDEAGLSVNKLANYYDEDGELAGAQTVEWLSRNGYELDAKEGEATIKRRKRQIARQHLEAAKEYIANVQLGKFPLRKR